MANLNLNCEGYESYLVDRQRSDFDHITMGTYPGVHYIFKFDNNYGASVIKQYGSYGYTRNLWELAVIEFRNIDDPDDYDLCYDTPVAYDVVGHLTDEKVRELLEKIKAL